MIVKENLFTENWVMGQDLGNLIQSYQDQPYLSAAYPESSIERLHHLSLVRGLSPVDLKRARVLEIGCASGGNLIPMAIRHPEAEFIGIDLAENQIARAQSDSQEAALSNIQFQVVDLSAFACETPFDYVIVHGVLSWIPPFKRQELYQCLRQHSHKNSILYLSFNTQPGWAIKTAVRELMLLFRSQKPEASPQDVIDFVERVAQKSRFPFPQELGAQLRSRPWSSVEHDELELFNEPLPFQDFKKEIELAGLFYAFDTLGNPHRRVRKFLEGQTLKTDWSFEESLGDWLTNRSHRNAVLVSQVVTQPLSPQEESLKKFWVRLQRPVTTQNFTEPLLKDLQASDPKAQPAEDLISKYSFQSLCDALEGGFLALALCPDEFEDLPAEKKFVFSHEGLRWFVDQEHHCHPI